jgi:hypothetical protein
MLDIRRLIFFSSLVVFSFRMRRRFQRYGLRQLKPQDQLHSKPLRWIGFLRQQSELARVWEACLPHFGLAELGSTMGFPEFAWCT